MKNYWWFQILCLSFLVGAVVYINIVPAKGEISLVADCPPGYTPTYLIQGDGDTSPLVGFPLTTCGVVVGVSASLRGVFIQDPAGDGITSTSDGLFVYHPSGVGRIAEGDLLEVYGHVSEYYGCIEIVAHTYYIIASGEPLPSPSSLDPPPDRGEADVYMEQREGMLVSFPSTVTVIGPTNYYGEVYVVGGDTGVGRIVVQDNLDQDGYRVGIDDGILPAEDLKVGDVLSNVVGPLHFHFDNWKIEQMELLSITATSLPAFPSFPEAAEGQFSVGAFNVLNLDTGSSDTKMDKVAADIEAMGWPTFLALSEIATDECEEGEVMTALRSRLLSSYGYVASHPDVGCHGVALMWREDQMGSIDGWTTLQGCSPVGSSSSDYDPLWSMCRGMGWYPLFSRRPVVLTATVSYDEIETQVVLVAVHLKAKTGSSTCGDPECADRRLEQAEHVADFVSTLVAKNVIVLGDLNDFLDSQPLQVLYSMGMTSTFYSLSPDARFSYIYEGWSQALDHVLLSPALGDMVESFDVLHVNADYPNAWGEADIQQRASDHDPLLAYFNLPRRLRMYLPVVVRGE